MKLHHAHNRFYFKIHHDPSRRLFSIVLYFESRAFIRRETGVTRITWAVLFYLTKNKKKKRMKWIDKCRIFKTDWDLGFCVVEGKATKSRNRAYAHKNAGRNASVSYGQSRVSLSEENAIDSPSSTAAVIHPLSDLALHEPGEIIAKPTKLTAPQLINKRQPTITEINPFCCWCWRPYPHIFIFSTGRPTNWQRSLPPN